MHLCVITQIDQERTTIVISAGGIFSNCNGKLSRGFVECQASVPVTDISVAFGRTTVASPVPGK